MQLSKNLADEANAISDYTQAISMAEDDTTKALLTEIRNDELGHAQKLIVALTEVLGGGEPVEAERMDGFGDNKGDKRVIIECRDPADRIIDLLNYIKSTANIGHSFPVVVASKSDHKKEFYIDGDGPDYIYTIKCSTGGDGE